MADLKGYIIGFLVVALFFFSIYSFTIGMGSQNNQSDMIDGSEYNVDFNKLSEQIGNQSEDARKWQEKFTSDNPLKLAGGLILFSVWGIARLMWGAIEGLTSVIFVPISNVLGIDPMIMGVISAILIILLIFAIWKVIKQGE